MSQHFLLSPAAKTLSIAKVMRMTEDQARRAFRNIRWADTGGEPVCPVCGCCESYDLATRQVFKCRGCHKQYSITSGTIFHGRKLAVRDILAAIAVFINGAKGYSALQLSRDLSLGYKTAFVLLHKVREAIKLARNEGALSGSVAVDGAYFGGYVKPANNRSDLAVTRRATKQIGYHPDKRCDPWCQWTSPDPLGGNSGRVDLTSFNRSRIALFGARFKGFLKRVRNMRDQKITADMVPTIKLARQRKYNYARIASYFQINQGRIADIMKGRRFPDIPPAKELPADFPPPQA